MSSKATNDFRKRRKENLIRVCGNKCTICGYDKIPSALEFHHINPEEKLYGISAYGNCHDLELDLAEVKKCILICANCHREVENNLYSKEYLMEIKIFDEDYAQFLRDDKQNRVGTKQYFCSNCGTEITKYSESGLCSICVKEQQRKAIRPEREELKKLIRTMPFTKIAELFGVSDNAIRKWCDAEGLPRKVTEIKKITDQEWEKL